MTVWQNSWLNLFKNTFFTFSSKFKNDLDALKNICKQEEAIKEAITTYQHMWLSLWLPF